MAHGPELAAGGAKAQDVEAVAVGLEAFGVGYPADGIGDAALKARRESDVGDLATIDAEQVVVVLGQVLG
jgi:hypothetical protein